MRRVGGFRRVAGSKRKANNQLQPGPPLPGSNETAAPVRATTRAAPTTTTTTTVQVGKAGTFLLQTAPTLSDEALIGKVPNEADTNNNTAFTNLSIVTKFLSQYRAMVVLAQTNATNNDIEYLPTVANFEQTQKDRQAAGLRTNTSRATTPEGVAQVLEDHASALGAAMAHAKITTDRSSPTSTLTKNRLLQWHATLLSTNTPQAGRYRTTQARAGTTLFCPPAEIDREMEALLAAIQTLHTRWIDALTPPTNLATTTVGTNSCLAASVYHGFAMAAILLYGVCDVHPFADGNGRMGRLGVNWMVSRLLGLPFTITVAATHQQRQSYVAALRHGHTAIRINHTAPPTSVTPIFEPLIHMLLDRAAHAVLEVERLLDQKSQAATSEEEARIARRVREQNAAGPCIICLDDNPNIATLCCGQAVHLNCIAEWLSNHTTCVSCRNPLPSMTARPLAPVAGAAFGAIPLPNGMDENGQLGTTTTDGEGDDDDTGHHPSPLHNAFEDAEETTEVYGAEEEEEEGPRDETASAEDEEPDDQTAAAYAAYDEARRCSYCNNLAAPTCENHCCNNCCVSQGELQCERHGTTQDTETMSAGHDDHETATDNGDETNASSGDDNTITTAGAAAAAASVRCQSCNKIAAPSCGNQCCGRCCVLQGQFHCDRHGT